MDSLGMRCITTTCVCVYTHGNSQMKSSLIQWTPFIIHLRENHVGSLVETASMLSCWVPVSILNECVALYSKGQQHIQCCYCCCCS